ncbi:hypothetical protein BO70DRAFT_427703 [Aspergillus heteromorphus CBS 117.55]|uniref:Uncharacterized protein n=1 Tax=Aspergillus heteromorphus CBS 117.55 TaxID=1448321 RepID=A0A317WKS5_9EURO|nr:uncharacterized protein BO70DRAFT_427703 [Aspergillus heteromorphus CBS 117.55]PWY86665.1 hypothetical protein BO70DRAFT_427703 [Aspergillus heteromorphus CBS 117.55]
MHHICWICGWYLDGSAFPEALEKGKSRGWSWNPFRTRKMFFRSFHEQWTSHARAFVAGTRPSTHRYPLTWLHLFRAIIYSRDDNQLYKRGYHLSGVGYYPGAVNDRMMYVPRDPEATLLGALWHDKATVAAMTPDPITEFGASESCRLQCVLVHSRCWDFVQRQTGPAGGLDLELLVKGLMVLRPQWNSSAKPKPADPKMFPDHRPDEKGNLRGILEADPVYNDNVRCALLASIRFSTVCRRRFPLRHIFRERFGVPIEIIYEICDFLELADIHHLLLAFEERLPVTYWEKYVPFHLIFETEGLEMDADSIMGFAVKYHGRWMERERISILNRRRRSLIWSYLERRMALAASEASRAG